jgi:hypothetical protein
LNHGGVSRRTRRRCAKASDLAPPERLRWRGRTRRPDGARRSDDVPRGNTLAGRRPIAAFALAAQVCRADLDRTRHARRAGKHARANVISRQRPAPNGGYVAGRNSWVDGEVPITPAHHHRAVHQRGATEKFRAPLERQ